MDTSDELIANMASTSSGSGSRMREGRCFDVRGKVSVADDEAPDEGQQKPVSPSGVKLGHMQPGKELEELPSSAWLTLVSEEVK